jgi:hypothetical protein
LGLNCSEEIISPPSFTLTEDLINQSPERDNLAALSFSFVEQELSAAIINNNNRSLNLNFIIAGFKI